MNSILTALLVSTVGFSVFLYGKKQHRPPQLVTGVLLMVYPYFITGTALQLSIGAGLIALLWFAVRTGW